MNKNYRLKSLLTTTLLVLWMFVLSGCDLTSLLPDSSSGVATDGTKFTVTYIDVGQADSILLENGGASMLIDAGNPQNGSDIVGQLSKKNISALDLIVATHPHADHIGGMSKVIQAFDVENFWAPKRTANTKSFENMMNALSAKDVSVTAPTPGTTFLLGHVTITVLSGGLEDAEDVNDSSIVLRADFGDSSFLFTGDATDDSEKSILSSKYAGLLDVDVLKVGHHGSSSSSSDSMLKAATPDISVISCGKNNDYGHPHREVMQRLGSINTQILRTDLEGNVTILSDGDTLTVSTNNNPSAPSAPDAPNAPNAPDAPNAPTYSSDTVAIMFIGNNRSKVYHSDDCASLPDQKNRTTFSSADEASKAGYSPHSVCIKN